MANDTLSYIVNFQLHLKYSIFNGTTCHYLYLPSLLFLKGFYKQETELIQVMRGCEYR